IGILSLQLVFSSGMKQFLLFGLIGLIVGTGVPFLFFFEDKRILNEARRRNQFVARAEKRWEISKKIYILIILTSVLSAFWLIQEDKNFMKKGTMTSVSRFQ